MASSAKDAEARPIFREFIEIARDLAAEGAHGAHLGRELGARFLDVTLGRGAAEELRAEATATFAESAAALRQAVSANLAFVRTAIGAQGRATEWAVGIIDAWLATHRDKPGAAPSAERDARRARLATLLGVVDGLRRRTAPPPAPEARGPDATVRLGRAGGATLLQLVHPGPGEVRAFFHVGACARDGGAPFRVLVSLDPEELTLRPQVKEAVQLTVPWDPRFEPGSIYRLPIVVAGLGIKLVVHIVAEPQAKEPS